MDFAPSFIETKLTELSPFGSRFTRSILIDTVTYRDYRDSLKRDNNNNNNKK